MKAILVDFEHRETAFNQRHIEPSFGRHRSPASMTEMDTKLLEGERALVTGCAGGIGRGIARALKAPIRTLRRHSKPEAKPSSGTVSACDLAGGDGEGTGA